MFSRVDFVDVQRGHATIIVRRRREKTPTGGKKKGTEKDTRRVGPGTRLLFVSRGRAGRRRCREKKKKNGCRGEPAAAAAAAAGCARRFSSVATGRGVGRRLLTTQRCASGCRRGDTRALSAHPAGRRFYPDAREFSRAYPPPCATSCAASAATVVNVSAAAGVSAATRTCPPPTTTTTTIFPTCYQVLFTVSYYIDNNNNIDVVITRQSRQFSRVIAKTNGSIYRTHVFEKKKNNRIFRIFCYLQDETSVSICKSSLTTLRLANWNRGFLIKFVRIAEDLWPPTLRQWIILRNACQRKSWYLLSIVLSVRYAYLISLTFFLDVFW